MPKTDSTPQSKVAARQNLWGNVQFIVNRVLALDLGGISSMMTLATLTGLVPLLALSLAIFAIFPAFSSLRAELDQLILQSFLPEAYSGILIEYIREFSAHAAGLTTFGLIGLGITALLLINKIFDTINRIFHVKKRRHFAQRLLIYWALLTVGPFAVTLSIALTGQLTALALSDVDQSAASYCYQIGQLLLQCLTFALIYKWIPNKPVKFLHACMGGLVVSLLYIIVKDGFAAYVAHGSLTNIYGAFAALPVLVLWIHIGWYLLFAGAAITALIPEITQARKVARIQAKGEDFDTAYAILSELILRERANEPAVIALQKFRTHYECTHEAWEEGLQALVDTHYVCLTGDDDEIAVALIAPSDTMTLEPLCRHLLVDLELPHLKHSDFSKHLLASESLRLPIRTLFTSSQPS